MTIKPTKPWGLVVPGRPPTPSEGHAQSYARVGPEASQRLITFDNGTAISFGPEDPVDEFGSEHPFGDQIAQIDRTIRDCQSVSQRYANGQDDDNQAYHAFRTGKAINPSQVMSVRVGNSKFSQEYYQVPSRLASVSTLISVYATQNKSHITGGAHPGLSADTRFGLLGRTAFGTLEEHIRRETDREREEQARERDELDFRGVQVRPAPRIPQQAQAAQAQAPRSGRQHRRRRPQNHGSRQQHQREAPKIGAGEVNDRMLASNSHDRIHRRVQSNFQPEPHNPYMGQNLVQPSGKECHNLMNPKGQLAKFHPEVHNRYMQERPMQHDQQQSIGYYGVGSQIHGRCPPPGFPPQYVLNSPPLPPVRFPNYEGIPLARQPQPGPIRPSQGDREQYHPAESTQQALFPAPTRHEGYMHRHRPTAQRASRQYASYLDRLNRQPPTAQGLRGDVVNGEMVLSVHPPTPATQSSTPNILQAMTERGQQMSVGSQPVPGFFNTNPIRSRVWNDPDTGNEQHRGRSGRSSAAEHRRTQPVSAIGSEILQSRRSSPGAGRGYRGGLGGGPNRSASVGQM